MCTVLVTFVLFLGKTVEILSLIVQNPKNWHMQAIESNELPLLFNGKCTNSSTVVDPTLRGVYY